MVIIITGVIAIFIAGTVIFMNQPSFGKLPAGERLERIKRSPNFRNDQFQNQSPTTLMAGGKSRIKIFWEFLFTKVKDLRPEKDLPAVKTDLRKIPLQEDILVWMGHSSLYMQISGKRIVIDPVLRSAAPMPYMNKAFKGTGIYEPDDLPDIDYLLISHDHWDHLDYETVIQLKKRIKKIICPLGVGAHFEYWGFSPADIIELDWNEHVQPDENIRITALPARHFSGRGLTSNKSLWAGYMLQSTAGNIYLSGDTGYDTHFKAIKETFGTIDFAILENGQYNEDWKYIHMLPDHLVQAVKDLEPKRVMTVHNSKYALARHAWYEPLEQFSEAATQHHFQVVTPMIGEIVHWKDSTQLYTKWWETR